MSITGRWRIVETELWDSDALDLAGPAFIEFGEDGSGSFGFIAVQGWMDCREAPRGGRPGVEFSWEGSDECDPASGRGWAALEEDGSLCGRVFFHLGDDSGFTAVREGEPQPGTAPDPGAGRRASEEDDSRGGGSAVAALCAAGEQGLWSSSVKFHEDRPAAANLPVATADPHLRP